MSCSSVPVLDAAELADCHMSIFCGICHVRFYSKTAFEQHFLSHNTLADNIISCFPLFEDEDQESDIVNIFVCEICHDEMFDKDEFENHLKTHSFNLTQSFEAPMFLKNSSRPTLGSPLKATCVDISRVNVMSIIRFASLELKSCVFCSEMLSTDESIRVHLESSHHLPNPNDDTEKLLSSKIVNPPSCVCRPSGPIGSNSSPERPSVTNETLSANSEKDTDKYSLSRQLDLRWRKRRINRKDLEKVAEENFRYGTNSAKALSSKRHQLGNGEFYCKYRSCMANFACKDLLANHERAHLDYNALSNFCCRFCLDKFSTSTQVCLHERRHMNIRVHKCMICEKTFVTKGDLRVHLRVHSGERPYQCRACGSSFATSSTRCSHERTCHSGAAATDSLKFYHCILCNKHFASSTSLKNHNSRAHSIVKSFKCNFCTTSFAVKGDLVVHERKHDPAVRPYKCRADGCGRWFITSSRRCAHEQSHFRNNKIVACAGCNCAFSTIDIFKTHVKICL